MVMLFLAPSFILMLLRMKLMISRLVTNFNPRSLLRRVRRASTVLAGLSIIRLCQAGLAALDGLVLMLLVRKRMSFVRSVKSMIGLFGGRRRLTSSKTEAFPEAKVSDESGNPEGHVVAPNNADSGDDATSFGVPIKAKIICVGCPKSVSPYDSIWSAGLVEPL